MHQLKLQYNQLRDDYEALKRELYATQEENKHLKEQLKQSKFGFDSIKDTNAKIFFFTGLQSLQMVMWLLDIVKRSTLVLKGGLSWENHLLLVLMKVRLGLTNRPCLQIWASILNCIKNTKRLDTHVVLNSETFDNVA